MDAGELNKPDVEIRQQAIDPCLLGDPTDRTEPLPRPLNAAERAILKAFAEACDKGDAQEQIFQDSHINGVKARQLHLNLLRRRYGRGLLSVHRNDLDSY